MENERIPEGSQKEALPAHEELMTIGDAAERLGYVGMQRWSGVTKLIERGLIRSVLAREVGWPVDGHRRYTKEQRLVYRSDVEWWRRQRIAKVKEAYEKLTS